MRGVNMGEEKTWGRVECEQRKRELSCSGG